MTISDKANKELYKAKKALHNALEELTNTIAYNNKNDIFHSATTNEVNHIINAITTLNEIM